MDAHKTAHDDNLVNEQYKERLRIALKAARICVFEVDVVNQLYTFFENAEDIFGVPGEKILEDVRPFSQLPPAEYQKAASDYFSHPDDHREIDKAFQQIFAGHSATYEARMRAGGSDYIWCKIDVTPIIRDRIPVRMIGVITNISEQKAKTVELTEALKLDGFTGLYNKESSGDLIRKCLRENADQKHALILLDIDHFKNFNDTYGHAIGDIIIKLVADSLKSSVRRTDIVGRFGGDEFIVFLQNIPDIDWLREKLQQLIIYENEHYSCSASIGVALFPEDADEFASLFHKADAALYHSKLTRRNYTFSSDMPQL
ncbi:MAG: sensor domain-containing diguanylate cyclase [Eubacteriales bacterium]|nr:sensor domain-containing diguanylate cyclase [Eubacteriales bacterium]